jgi:acyl-coenzyme A thioesterase PaaI-like protein
MHASTFPRLINLWPPFLFNSIHVTAIADDWTSLTVRLRLRFWNRNYVGTQFGGNLFAMTDPMWMLMALHRLGENYFVWDKAAAIEFVSPTKEDVYAHFSLPDVVVDELRAAAADGSKVLRWLEVGVETAAGTVVARVRKQLYVRLKPDLRPSMPAEQAKGS